MYRAEQNIEVIPNGSGRYRLSVHIEPENYDRLRREDVICYLRIKLVLFSEKYLMQT